MDRIKINGVPGYDGEYDFDYGALTNRDARTIKQVAGLTIPEISEAVERSDNDLFVAFAMIALRQAGVKADLERFLDAPLGTSIEYLGEEVEGDAVPPPSEKPSEPRTTSTRSGEASHSDSASPEPSQNHIGDQTSAIGAI